MRRVLVAIWLIVSPAHGAGIISDDSVQSFAAPTTGYQGPGDVISGAVLFWSCSRAYTAAFAATAAAICDFNDATTGTAVCTLKIATTGFADLTGTYCAGSVNIVTACVAGCTISKVYDQTGTGNHGLQATNANRPTVVFSGDPTSTLPVMFNSISTSAVLLATSGSPSWTQPILISSVYIRTSGTVVGSILSNAGTQFCLCAGGANVMSGNFGASITAAATDAAWHSASIYGNGTSGANNIDGSDTSPINMGATNPSGTAVRNFRNAPNNELVGNIAEIAVWNSTTTTAADRNAISANQHGANGYNF